MSNQNHSSKKILDGLSAFKRGKGGIYFKSDVIIDFL